MRACRRASPRQLHDAEEGVVVVTAERKDRVTAAAVVAMEAEERAVVVATAAEGKEHASAAAAHRHRVDVLERRCRCGGHRAWSLASREVVRVQVATLKSKGLAESGYFSFFLRSCW